MRDATMDVYYKEKIKEEILKTFDLYNPNLKAGSTDLHFDFKSYLMLRAMHVGYCQETKAPVPKDHPIILAIDTIDGSHYLNCYYLPPIPN